MQLLAKYPDEKLRVLVVWEPILWSDWRRPTSGTLARITDHRARQFWDPKHLVSEELARIETQHPEQPQPECCVDKGFHWDEAVLYPPSSHWKDGSRPEFWNGPVYKIAPKLSDALGKQR